MYNYVRNCKEASYRKLSSTGKSNERRTYTTIAQGYYKALFKKGLLQFITEPNPFPAMLKWVMPEMMRVESEAKVGAAKGKHVFERRTYFPGARARRIDTRVGTVYLLVPNVRKGGYIPFFIPKRRRSEQVLIAVVQEVFINGVSTVLRTDLQGTAHQAFKAAAVFGDNGELR